MTNDQQLLLAGVLFFLIAVVGGGFSIREIKFPRVPAWARTASAVLGLVFTGYYFWQELGRDAGIGPSAVFENDVGEISVHGLQARAIRVTTRKREPKVGDPITIEFQLEYVGTAEEQPRLVASYVSSEDPDGDNRDFGWSRSDRDLQVGVVVSSTHVVALDKTGGVVVLALLCPPPPRKPRRGRLLPALERVPGLRRAVSGSHRRAAQALDPPQCRRP